MNIPELALPLPDKSFELINAIRRTNISTTDQLEGHKYVFDYADDLIKAGEPVVILAHNDPESLSPTQTLAYNCIARYLFQLGAYSYRLAMLFALQFPENGEFVSQAIKRPDGSTGSISMIPDATIEEFLRKVLGIPQGEAVPDSAIYRAKEAAKNYDYKELLQKVGIKGPSQSPAKAAIRNGESFESSLSQRGGEPIFFLYPADPTLKFKIRSTRWDPLRRVAESDTRDKLIEISIKIVGEIINFANSSQEAWNVANIARSGNQNISPIGFLDHEAVYSILNNIQFGVITEPLEDSSPAAEYLIDVISGEILNNGITEIALQNIIAAFAEDKCRDLWLQQNTWRRDIEG